jgi:hypothetical protein
MKKQTIIKLKLIFKGEIEMNREIIFKAKRIDNGEWVEGYYVKGK